MTMPLQGKNAAAFKQPEFLYIWTMTGLGLLFNDPEAFPTLLSPDEELAKIGAAVRKSLESSKELENEDFQNIFHSGVIQKNSKRWEDFLLSKYGYKSKKSIYKELKKCTIHESLGSISFSPTLHYELQAWSGMEDVDDVAIPSTSSDEETGAALIEAFARCGDDQNSS